eukprot:TRINITY_DN22850_c0_g1_i1.p1 TRINITY_DN22850_c0_g1~~TRINITY_DN22850_c0_g1_i1.p1  ORF type:complete len:441 (+),score=75.21 TRINITY_DN22850_c0_g1_i1:100-1323(+)
MSEDSVVHADPQTNEENEHLATPRQEEEDVEEAPIECHVLRVSKPTHVAGGILDSGHIVYEVESKIEGGDYNNEEYKVLRRYQAFATLRDQLTVAFPGVIIPVLPDKELQGMVAKFTGNEAITQYRMRHLNKFISACGNSPILMKSSIIRNFLTSDDWETSTATKWRVPKGIKDSISKQMSIRGIKDNIVPEAYIGLYKYLISIEQELQSLREYIEIQLQSFADTGEAMKEVGDMFNKLAAVETELGDMSNVAKDLINTHTFANQLGESYGTFSVTDIHPLQDVLDTISYYGNMTESLRTNLYSQKSLELQLVKKQKLVGELLRKRDDAAAAEKKQKYTTQLDTLMADVRSEIPELELISAEFDRQLVTYRNTMTADWKAALTAIINHRIEVYHRQVIVNFEPILDF